MTLVTACARVTEMPHGLNSDSIHEVKLRGRTARFFIDNEKDIVQYHQFRGQFYEIEDLEAHRQLIPYTGVVADVGTNVGNHAIYYGLHTRAEKVFVFEPNRRARDILLQNIKLNDLEGKIKLDFVDCGIGSRAGFANVDERACRNNLGAASLSTNDAGNIAVRTLDEVFSDIPVSFLKIDVEGMELDVLAGGIDVISKFKPIIAIEVDNENNASFWNWCSEMRYHVVRAFKMIRPNINYICVPKT